MSWFYVIGLSFDKTHSTYIWVDLGYFKYFNKTLFPDQVLEPLSLFKKTSSECKIIKAQQLARQLHLSSLRKLFYIRCAQHLLDSFSTPAICRDLRLSEFQYDFLGIRECVFGLSFLLTLDI